MLKLKYIMKLLLNPEFPPSHRGTQKYGSKYDGLVDVSGFR